MKFSRLFMTATAALAMAMAPVSFISCSGGDDSSDAVPEETMTLTLDYSALNDEVAKVKVTYGWAGNDAGDEHYAPEIEATINSESFTATAILEKKYAKPGDWCGFDNTKIVLLDEEDEEIECAWDKLYFEYNKDGVTLTASEKVISTGTLTLTFTGFEIPDGSVVITYGHDQSGTATKTESATVAEDGKSATVTLSSAYAKEGKWFNNTVIVVKDANDNVIEPKFTSYFDFAEDGMSLTLTLVSADIEYTSICTEKQIALVAEGEWGWDTYTPVLSVEELSAAANATMIKIVMTGTTNKVCFNGNKWLADYTSDLSEVILSGDDLANALANGLWACSGVAETITVTVSYAE